MQPADNLDIYQPLYRLRSTVTGDHFYTMSPAERDNAINNFQYVSEGTAASVLPPTVQSLALQGPVGPLYRLVKTSDPQPQATTELTCDGKPVAANAQVYMFMAQDNLTKLIYTPVWQEKANSVADAQACAQKAINAAIASASAVRLDALRTFYFAVYSDGQCLPPVHTVNTSSDDALVQLRATFCRNCTYQDITSDVTNAADGSINNDLVDAWCINHPNPPN